MVKGENEDEGSVIGEDASVIDERNKIGRRVPDNQNK